MPKATPQPRRKQPAYALITETLARRIRTGDVPAGTVLHVTAWFDNTAGNKDNPDPTNPIAFGQRSIDDMAFAWVNYVWLTDDDFKAQVDERKAKTSRTTQQQQQQQQ